MDKNPWTGADLFILTGDNAKEFNLEQHSGLLVQRVVFSSILGQLGLRGGNSEIELNGERIIIGGDIILKINTVEFDVSDEALLNLANSIGNLNENTKLQVTILREGKKLVLRKN